MKFEAFDRIVKFFSNEIDAFVKCGLELDSMFLEYMLHLFGIDRFGDIPDADVHDKCIDAICAYSKDIQDALLSYEPEKS